MNLFKYLLLALVVLVALIVGVGFCLPGTYHVERSLAIKAKPGDVYALVGDLKTWHEWTVWNETHYPGMKQVIGEKSAGAGASYSWSGNKDSGSGTMTIVKADPEKGIAYELNYEQHPSSGEIRFEPAGDAVKVTWTNNGNLGMNPIARYFGLMMDGFLGPDFQTCLQGLKARVEGK